MKLGQVRYKITKTSSNGTVTTPMERLDREAEPVFNTLKVEGFVA